MCQALSWMCSQLFCHVSPTIARQSRLISTSLLCRVTLLGSPSPGQPGSTAGHPAVSLPPCSMACSLWGDCFESHETHDIEVRWVGEGHMLRILSGAQAGWWDQGRQEDTLYLGVPYCWEHSSVQAGCTCRTSGLCTRASCPLLADVRGMSLG